MDSIGKFQGSLGDPGVLVFVETLGRADVLFGDHATGSGIHIIDWSRLQICPVQYLLSATLRMIVEVLWSGSEVPLGCKRRVGRHDGQRPIVCPCLPLNLAKEMAVEN